MDKTNTPETIDHRRRRVIGAAAIAIAAVELGIARPAKAAQNSFGALQQVNAGVLNIGYAEEGPADGPPVILCMVGLMTSIAMSMSRPCWRRRGTA